ncbi:ABC transporter substrate-binding protein [Ruegeria lacuscaerulensis]|uniref:ABC transporter substrate-binding protein n=1 Tax=Ruegeria lacuscaerulensis TaxID=55218 RepID=UPI00147A12B2|nr:ABC transporter substrate-binding protein [Ruegeria lacuscaerulensis]
MSSKSVTRRYSLTGGVVASTGLALPMIFPTSSSAGFTNAPNGSTVTFGFNAALSGPFSEEGNDQLRGQKLAVEHLNGQGDGGCLNAFSSRALAGNGVLGKKVTFVVADSEGKASKAHSSAKAMINSDGAVMLNGGSTSGEAIAVQNLCQDAGVIFMAGLAHTNDLTGKEKKANGFRNYFNAYMTGASLAPVLAAELGTDRRAYHLSADYNWGWSQEEAIVASTEALGWQTVNRVKTTLTSTEFTTHIASILNSGADVLILNHYGANLEDSLASALQFGLLDKVANGKDFKIVVPVLSDLMAARAGASIKGVLGSMNWNWQLQDKGTKAFVSSFQEAYGFPPSIAAQTGYSQILLYADAVERAGTFNPCGVVEALEDFEFDGLGNGPSWYRGADHQCFKDVLVVQGRDSPTDPYDRLEVVDVTPRAQVEYDPQHPMFSGGQLGKCNPGA